LLGSDVYTLFHVKEFILLVSLLIFDCLTSSVPSWRECKVFPHCFCWDFKRDFFKILILLVE